MYLLLGSAEADLCSIVPGASSDLQPCMLPVGGSVSGSSLGSGLAETAGSSRGIALQI